MANVKMNFPRNVTLTVAEDTDSGRRTTQLQFKKGVNDVPEQHADHPYLKAHGVERVSDMQAKPPVVARRSAPAAPAKAPAKAPTRRAPAGSGSGAALPVSATGVPAGGGTSANPPPDGIPAKAVGNAPNSGDGNGNGGEGGDS